MDPGLLEKEDDEFEEFPAHEPGRAETEEEKEEVSVWDEFSNQLRSELQSQVQQDGPLIVFELQDWPLENSMTFNYTLSKIIFRKHLPLQ